MNLFQTNQICILFQATSDRRSVASFPDLPCFYLPFAFTIIHGSRRPAKNGEGLRAFIMWMMSGGREGWYNRELHTRLSIRALYHRYWFQTLAWSKLLVLNSKKLAFKFSMYILRILAPPPNVPLDVIHVMNVPRPPLFFTGIHTIVNANRR